MYFSFQREVSVNGGNRNFLNCSSQGSYSLFNLQTQFPSLTVHVHIQYDSSSTGTVDRCYAKEVRVGFMHSELSLSTT